MDSGTPQKTIISEYITMSVDNYAEKKHVKTQLPQLLYHLFHQQPYLFQQCKTKSHSIYSTMA